MRKPLSLSHRFRIFERDNFTCVYCGRKAPDVQLEVDHRTPVSRGGSDLDSNLITACWDCNRGKSAYFGIREPSNERDEDGWPIYVPLHFDFGDKKKWCLCKEDELTAEEYQWLIEYHIEKAENLARVVQHHKDLAEGYAQRAANRFNRPFDLSGEIGESISPQEAEANAQAYLTDLRTLRARGNFPEVVLLRINNPDGSRDYTYKNDADCVVDDYIRVIEFHLSNSRTETAQAYHARTLERFGVDLG